MNFETIIGVTSQLLIVFAGTEYFKANNKFNKEDILALIIFVSSGLIFFYLLDKISILLYIVFLIVYNYLKIKHIKKAVTYVNLSSITMVISDFITNFVVELIDNNSIVIYVIILFIIVILIDFFIKYLFFKFIDVDRFVTPILLFLILSTYYIIIFAYSDEKILLSDIKIIMIIFLLMLVIFLMFMIIEYRVKERISIKKLKESEKNI